MLAGSTLGLPPINQNIERWLVELAAQLDRISKMLDLPSASSVSPLIQGGGQPGFDLKMPFGADGLAPTPSHYAQALETSILGAPFGDIVASNGKEQNSRNLGDSFPSIAGDSVGSKTDTPWQFAPRLAGSVMNDLGWGDKNLSAAVHSPQPYLGDAQYQDDLFRPQNDRGNHQSFPQGFLPPLSAWNFPISGSAPQEGGNDRNRGKTGGVVDLAVYRAATNSVRGRILPPGMARRSPR